jgi:Meckel syndrome type 1 protein
MAKRTGNMSALAVAPRKTPQPSRQYGRLSSVAAILFGVVLFGSAAALLWSPRGSEPSGAPAPTVATQALKADSAGRLPSAPQTATVSARPAPAVAPPAVTLQRAAPSAVAPAVIPPAVAAPPVVAAPLPAAPAKAPVAASRTAAPEEERAVKRRAVKAPAPRRRPIPRAEPAATSGETTTKPEWVPNKAPAAPAEKHNATSVGTNSAPIFD